MPRQDWAPRRRCSSTSGEAAGAGAGAAAEPFAPVPCVPTEVGAGAEAAAGAAAAAGVATPAAAAGAEAEAEGAPSVPPPARVVAAAPCAYRQRSPWVQCPCAKYLQGWLEGFGCAKLQRSPSRQPRPKCGFRYLHVGVALSAAA
mmetsp:Transcript_72296/g.225415  ORF Transcript_72296/g.225415 Transcript_72296/m.225415 type:complete len:145 (-) Transcript_72296:65-499(-)